MTTITDEQREKLETAWNALDKTTPVSVRALVAATRQVSPDGKGVRPEAAGLYLKERNEADAAQAEAGEPPTSVTEALHQATGNVLGVIWTEALRQARAETAEALQAAQQRADNADVAAAEADEQAAEARAAQQAAIATIDALSAHIEKLTRVIHDQYEETRGNVSHCFRDTRNRHAKTDDNGPVGDPTGPLFFSPLVTDAAASAASQASPGHAKRRSHRRPSAHTRSRPPCLVSGAGGSCFSPINRNMRNEMTTS